MYYDWVDSYCYSPIPKNAVWCSKDKDGSDIYIGRCQIENSIVAAKIVPQRGEAYAPYKGREIPLRNFKILINYQKHAHTWLRVTNGEIPNGVVECGYDQDHFKLYIGKAYHNGYCIPGYVNSNSKFISVSYGGSEYKYYDYEVLLQ